MSGDQLIPLSINLHQQSKLVEIKYQDGAHFELSCEYLRVYSPSADVSGHHPDQRVLQLNKQDVGIKKIEPVGHYAVRIVFDDGHETGLYTWEYLYQLGNAQEENWQSYLTALQEAGHTR